MNVPNVELDRWARETRQVRAWLTKIGDRLRAANAPEELQSMALSARNKTHDLVNDMIAAGAEDPMEADRRARLGESYQPARAVPLELLSSPAAQEYARAIRAAARACRAMEEERYGPGIDGYAESLEDAAKAAELEVYGPAGLNER
ncbi:MAG TPA: hypothetical protein VKU00_07550 [Chthonomonadaceae bacterium]|nr:hypothetical protein [Chthonomonadaceae bacterium]